MSKASRYIMNGVEEIERLERQALIPAYSVEDEFGDLPDNPGKMILDAGCGTGVVARYLAARYTGSRVHACDLSEARIQGARDLTPDSPRVQYFASDLESIAVPDGTYHLITSRYVFEYLPSPLKVSSELLRILRPGGLARIVDLDGIIMNMHPCGDELARMLAELTSRLPLDFYVGRKIPGFLADRGFENVEWRVEAHGFRGEDLAAERVNMAERLQASLPTIESVFGSALRTRRFSELFLEATQNPDLVLFCNKFIVTGRKPSR